MTPERIEEIAGNYAQKHNEYPHLSALQVIKEAITEAIEEETSRFWATEKVFTDIAEYLGVQQGDVPGLLEEITMLKESTEQQMLKGPRLTCAACGKVTDSVQPFCEDCAVQMA